MKHVAAAGGGEEPDEKEGHKSPEVNLLVAEALAGEIRNSKLETRNKFDFPKGLPAIGGYLCERGRLLVWNRALKLEFRIRFEFRISNFEFHSTTSLTLSGLSDPRNSRVLAVSNFASSASMQRKKRSMEARSNSGTL